MHAICDSCHFKWQAVIEPIYGEFVSTRVQCNCTPPQSVECSHGPLIPADEETVEANKTYIGTLAKMAKKRFDDVDPGIMDFFEGGDVMADAFREAFNELNEIRSNNSDVVYHVDDFIERMHPYDRYDLHYASFFFMLRRLPAYMKANWERWIRKFKLFCEYRGRTYRVTGASRMGDIWLTSDFSQDTGYEHRVDIRECSKFSRTGKESDGL